MKKVSYFLSDLNLASLVVGLRLGREMKIGLRGCSAEVGGCLLVLGFSMRWPIRVVVLEEYGLGLVIPGMVLVLELALGFGWVVGSVNRVSFAGGFLSVSVVFSLLVGLGLGLDVFGFSGLLSFFLVFQVLFLRG